MNESKLTEIIEKYGEETHAIVAILQDIQEAYNYLPKDALVKLSHELNIPLSRILSVATFYKAFSLTPKGKYPINVCLGTACHVRGGERIMNKMERELGIKRGETSEDLNFSLDEVRCLGCCGLAPVVMIGKDVHGKLSESKITAILDQYKK
jgi:NADH:ubiquinone oxidoreductase subunit E